jgi:hypothetical protein
MVLQELDNGHFVLQSRHNINVSVEHGRHCRDQLISVSSNSAKLNLANFENAVPVRHLRIFSGFRSACMYPIWSCSMDNPRSNCEATFLKAFCRNGHPAEV